ncbi:hypothetical protein EYF80_025699 [Liparis tanakae]|uniref:Uncharacterized protein n=1 Tax=Liparis tanakae TaxID=230148 RepID=A0A4Z2HEN4_9TELE|nr:hypothetical protein EYF80_025699 [Liparis tanakae]
MQEEDVDSGSDSGEMEAGLQMDTGGAALPLTAGSEGPEGGVNWPLAPLSELASRAGELFFFTGLLTALFWAPLWAGSLWCVLPWYPTEGCSMSTPEADKLSPFTVYGGCFR